MRLAVLLVASLGVAGALLGAAPEASAANYCSSLTSNSCGNYVLCYGIHRTPSGYVHCDVGVGNDVDPCGWPECPPDR